MSFERRIDLDSYIFHFSHIDKTQAAFLFKKQPLATVFALATSSMQVFVRSALMRTTICNFRFSLAIREGVLEDRKRFETNHIFFSLHQLHRQGEGVLRGASAILHCGTHSGPGIPP